MIMRASGNFLRRTTTSSCCLRSMSFLLCSLSFAQYLVLFLTHHEVSFATAFLHGTNLSPLSDSRSIYLSDAMKRKFDGQKLSLRKIIQWGSADDYSDEEQRDNVSRVKGIGGVRRKTTTGRRNPKGRRPKQNEAISGDESSNTFMDEDEALHSSLSELRSMTKTNLNVDEYTSFAKDSMEGGSIKQGSDAEVREIKLENLTERLDNDNDNDSGKKNKKKKKPKSQDKSPSEFSRFIRVNEISRRHTVLKLEPTKEELKGLMERFEFIDLPYMQTNVTLARIPQIQEAENDNEASSLSSSSSSSSSSSLSNGGIKMAVNAIHIHGIIHAVIDMRCAQTGDVFPYIMATEFDTFVKEITDEGSEVRSSSSGSSSHNNNNISSGRNTKSDTEKDENPDERQTKDMSMLDDDIYDDEISSSDFLDVGEIVAQYLYLRLPSYPIKPDLDFEAIDDSDGFTIKL